MLNDIKQRTRLLSVAVAAADVVSIATTTRYNVPSSFIKRGNSIYVCTVWAKNSYTLFNYANMILAYSM